MNLQFGQIAVIVGGMLCGCTATLAPVKPLQIRGLLFARKLTAADSVRLAKFGSVISVVRSDSVIVIQTNANDLDVVTAPGIIGMCQSLGSDSSALVEVELGAGPQRIDTAVAVLNAVGAVRQSVDTQLAVVGGRVQAFRLRELDAFPVLTYVYVVVCPNQQAGATHRLNTPEASLLQVSSQ